MRTINGPKTDLMNFKGNLPLVNMLLGKGCDLDDGKRVLTVRTASTRRQVLVDNAMRLDFEHQNDIPCDSSMIRMRYVFAFCYYRHGFFPNLRVISDCRPTSGVIWVIYRSINFTYHQPLK